MRTAGLHGDPSHSASAWLLQTDGGLRFNLFSSRGAGWIQIPKPDLHFKPRDRWRSPRFGSIIISSHERGALTPQRFNGSQTMFRADGLTDEHRLCSHHLTHPQVITSTTPSEVDTWRMNVDYRKGGWMNKASLYKYKIEGGFFRWTYLSLSSRSSFISVSWSSKMFPSRLCTAHSLKKRAQLWLRSVETPWHMMSSHSRRALAFRLKCQSSTPGGDN